MQTGIYWIKNQINQKIYVGQAANFKQRFGQHKRALRRGDHDNSHLQRAWNKYGEQCFSFTPIIYCHVNSLLFYEQAIIDGYKAEIGWDNMYNLNPHAGSSLGVKHPPEAAIKRVATRRANGTYTITDEWRENMRRGQANRLPHTQEYKDNMSRVLTGRSATWLLGKKQKPESVAKRVAKLTGQKRSPEACENIGKSLRGKKRSQAVKDQMSIDRMGRKRTPESVARGIETRKAKGWFLKDRSDN